MQMALVILILSCKVMMHTWPPSPSTAEDVPEGQGPNVKLAEGEAEAAPRDEEPSASDVRSMIASSTVNVLGAAGADCHQGSEELDIFEAGYNLESGCLNESSLSGTRVLTPRSLTLPGGLSPFLV